MKRDIITVPVSVSNVDLLSDFDHTKQYFTYVTVVQYIIL